jgi:hypothetical protein
MKLGQLISLITLFVLLAPYFSFAQGTVPPPENYPIPEIPSKLFSCLPNDTLRRCMLRLLGDSLRVLLVAALVFSAVMIAWAGIEYALYSSNDAERKKVKDRIIWASVGLVFAFVAWVLTTILAGVINTGTI